MNKERIFNVLLLLGETWEDTDRKIDLARQFCTSRNEDFVVRIKHSDLTSFQLDHVRNGVVPFSSRMSYLADKIQFVDENGTVKNIKDKKETTHATIS